MTKWTLPEGKLYTQSDLDAAVAAALREAAKVAANGWLYQYDTAPDRILAIDPDAGKALGRALAEAEARGMERAAQFCETHTMEIPMDRHKRQFAELYCAGDPTGSGTHHGMGYAAAIRAQKGEGR